MPPNQKHIPDEVTPLISSTDEDDDLATSQTENVTAIDKPLPVGQLMLLCFARIIEPVAFFSIFPFINQMIEECGDVAETDVGFYSGLIESIFSLTQMTLMIPWGRAADRIGRKPVLVMSLAGMSVSCALFGTSQKIWQMILFRSMAGLFSGTIVTVRASISEISTPKTQARAFSYFAFSNNVGIFLGPLMGGALSRPADQYPSIFGNIQFFKTFPYALPTFATGCIGATACIASALFVKETLQTKVEGSNKPSKPMKTSELLKSPGVSWVLFLYSYTMLLAMGYTAVMPVFYFTSIGNGGYGFTEFQISIFIGIAGLSQAMWLLFVFPSLQRRIGTGGVMRLCMSFWPIWFLLTPGANILLRLGWSNIFWVYAPTILVIGSGVAMSFTACQLALNDISPSPETLGTLTALSLTFQSAIRTTAPATFASLFATGVKHQIFAGYLAWVVLTLLAAGLRFSMRWFPAKAEGKLDAEHDDEETGP